MAHYTIIRKLGQGAFGEVLLATDNDTGRKVALKRIFMKEAGEGEFAVSAYRELQCHRLLQHPNIVPFRHHYLDSSALVVVLDYCPCDLHDLIAYGSSLIGGLPPAVVRTLARGLLRGLAHCHAMGIMHRDVKPANCMLSASGQLQLADFGLARPYARSQRPFTACGGAGGGIGSGGGSGGGSGSSSGGSGPTDGMEYTAQISSRWYRAPEILYGASRYTPALDLWAAGCILAELVRCEPLFPGHTDIEQLARIIKARGTPTPAVWPGVTSLPDYDKIQFEEAEGVPIASLLTPTSSSSSSAAAASAAEAVVAPRHEPNPHLLALVERLLAWNPAARPTAAEALRASYFTAHDDNDNTGDDTNDNDNDDDHEDEEDEEDAVLDQIRELAFAATQHAAALAAAAAAEEAAAAAAHDALFFGGSDGDGEYGYGDEEDGQWRLNDSGVGIVHDEDEEEEEGKR